MKKFIAAAMAAMLALTALSGCGKKGKSLEQIKKSGELVIATSPDFPPFESLNSDGSVEGIEIDVLNLICKQLGVELKIEKMDFDAVLSGVQAGKYDVGVSGITITEKRKKNVLFTDPYCLAAQAIVVKKDSAVKSKADLAGKKIAVQTGTTAETFCMENGYSVEAFSANNDAQSALLSGKVEAWVIDDLTAADMVKTYNSENGEQLVILSDVMTTEPYAFAFAFGSEDLVSEVNKIIADLNSSKTIEQIFKKYNAPYTAPDAK